MREKVLTLTTKDFEIQTFRAGGKGGQNQNKRNTGVRIIHHESGARGESREHRTQWQNKKAALRRLVEDPKFKYWVAVVTKRVESEEEYLARMMKPENIKTEVRIDGKWTEMKEIEDTG